MVDPSLAAGPLRPAELAAWLRGGWTIARLINGGAGRFDGHARFAVDPGATGTLTWREHGRLRLGSHAGPAERTLLIEPGADGAWLVRFGDGRPFHPLDLTTGSCEATHLCGADTYRGRYVVETADRFTVVWRVTGPRKDDVIESVYDRAA